MPYSNEYANPLGYSPLVTDEFVADRLKTFSFVPRRKETGPTEVELMPVLALDELASPAAYLQPERAFAVDGSLAVTSDEYSFQLAAVKIGCVVQDLKAKAALAEQAGPIDPDALARLYRTGAYTTLLPGEGVYGLTPGEDTWQDKFREELHATFKHLRLPFAKTPRPLLEALRATVPTGLTTMCVACHDAGRLKPAENTISLAEGAAFCPTCFREIHFTDFLFTESWLKEGKASDVFLAMMLILERTLFQGVLLDSLDGSPRLPWDRTVFIVDGPLAIYSTHSLNRYFLDRLQTYSTQPLAMGVEKTGSYVRFAQRPDVQAVLEPGSVAMITTEVANVLGGRAAERRSKHAFTYGKRFIYRTRDGHKTFVIMVPPFEGPPQKLTGERGEAADEWATYPTLRPLCEFLESNSTDQFGTATAALDIVAEANHTASLPKVLSEKFLDELLPPEARPSV